MLNGTVPFPVQRWKPSVGWSVDMDLRSHPDRCKDQDCTKLNLAKQKYAKDARMVHEERFKLEIEIHETIRNFIRRPFPAVRAGGTELVTEKVAARKKYLVVHFSHYYQIQGFHYPAEFAVAEFSVFNGLGEGVSGLIDIGKIPLGYDYSVRERRMETCNPHPPFDENFHPYQDALGLMENMARRHFPEGEQVIMFTLKEFVPIVMNGMEWLFEQTGKFFNVRILPMSVLVQILVNESQQPEYQQGAEPSNKAFYEVQHESQLEEPLHDTFYAYSPELACEFHAKPENERGVQNCSENYVKRLIFNACKVLTPFYRVSQQKNSHYPCYRAPNTKPMTRNGLKIYEVPNIRRMAEIQRFASSDRMSDLLRSQSHSGLSSAESSCDRSSPAPTTSSDSEDGSGSYSDDSVDTVELDPPDESVKLQSLFKVEQEFRYGYSLNQFMPRSVPAREYSNDRPTFEQAMVDFKLAREQSKPTVCGRGRGRGKTSLKQLKPLLPSFTVKDDIKPGQFEDALNAPKKRPTKISRCFDNMSVRSASSSGSVRSLTSANSNQSSHSGISESVSRLELTKKNVMLEPWETYWGASRIGGARSSASLAFDSVSTIGGYQVDELHTSEDELTDEGEIESASVAAMKQIAMGR